MNELFTLNHDYMFAQPYVRDTYLRTDSTAHWKTNENLSRNQEKCGPFEMPLNENTSKKNFKQMNEKLDSTISYISVLNRDVPMISNCHNCHHCQSVDTENTNSSTKYNTSVSGASESNHNQKIQDIQSPGIKKKVYEEILSRKYKQKRHINNTSKLHTDWNAMEIEIENLTNKIIRQQSTNNFHNNQPTDNYT